jgi:uncharacterized membrane protein YphA (DoxX/SURF4 family)
MRRWIWLPRLLLAGLFLYSGVVKVLDPAAFAQAIAGYRLLPDAWIPGMAFILPWMEIWCAFAILLSPLLRPAAWIWTTLMLLVFTVAKISALQRGLDISCGCTTSNAPMTWSSVAENLFWLALCVPGLRWDTVKKP